MNTDKKAPRAAALSENEIELRLNQSNIILTKKQMTF